MFQEYTLTDADLTRHGVTFVLILLTICILAKLAFTDSPKKLAWSISIVNSGIMIVISTVYYLNTWPNMLSLIQSGRVIDIVHTKNDYVVLTCLWFALANIIDISFGLIFYRKYLDILTAYIHHSVYIWMMYFSVTGNGGFASSRPFSPGFVLLAIEEIPTFLLALGSIYPAYRTDLGFGLTFFILRIVYHIFVFAVAALSGCDKPVLFIFLLTLSLHLYWFYKWARKYLFGRNKKQI